MGVTTVPGRAVASGGVAHEPAARGAARRLWLPLADGRGTSVHVAEHALARRGPRVVVMPGQEALVAWCAAEGEPEAMIGGFFVRPGGQPLGEVRTAGVLRRHVPFAAPWAGVRACLHVAGGQARIAFRHELPEEPRGDLLQAGPMLVRGGRPYYDAVADAEGFSAGARQFDSDITDGRHPRAALGLAPGRMIAVVCDGRSRADAGLTLVELARLMVWLGCDDALNLDGGGSATLVSGGRLRNRPRAAFERPEPGGRPVSTAVVFSARG